MIVDHIKNMERYPQLAKYAEKIMEFIEKCSGGTLPEGRFDLLPDDKLFATAQCYETKPKEQGRMESHRKYADLQYILSGRERIYYDLTEELTVEEDETPEKDVIFYRERPDKGGILLTAGMFGYYEPQDAHKPGIQGGDSAEKTEKIVFKIRMD